MTTMKQIREYYGVPAKRGMTVYQGDDCFTISGTTRHGMYLTLRDGNGGKIAIHPYDVNYQLSDGTLVRSAELKAKHDAKWDRFNKRLAKTSNM